MAGQHAYPGWLLVCKDELIASNEWDNVTQELVDAVQQQLTESHVTYFTDLSEAEKILFIERAAKAIQHGKSFRNMRSSVSQSLDHHLSNQVAKELLEDDPVDTKSEIIIGHAREGAVSLLKRWPEMKYKLHLCLNQPLPHKLRYIAWKINLQNQKVRKTYCDLLNQSPHAIKSKYEQDIGMKSEALLSAVPTFAKAFPELKQSKGIVIAMRSVLSYYHAMLHSKNPLIDVDFLLVIPFLAVALSVMHPDQLAAPNTVALLVEEYVTFMDQRPGFMKDSWSDDKSTEMRMFADTVAAHLESKDTDLSSAIQSVYSQGKDKDNHVLLLDAVRSLVRPLVRCLFVGFLDMETVLYIWDQYMIGLDEPSFQVIPPMCVVLLILLKDKLMKCQTAKEMEDTLQRQSCFLTIEQFQYAINRHYYRDLFSLLGKKDATEGMPILDPTQTLGVPAPWRHWSDENLPVRQRPTDRRQAREQRAADHLKYIQQKEMEKARRYQQEVVDKKQEEDRLAQQNANNRRQVDEDRSFLEQQLESERQKRLETERRAEAEITRLQREIAQLKRGGSSSPPTWPYMNPSNKPTSRISQVTGYHPPPSSALQNPDEAKPPYEVTEKLLQGFMDSLFYVGHGSGDEHTALNRASEQHLSTYRNDIRDAEITMTGRPLLQHDWDAMSDDDRSSFTDRRNKQIRLLHEQRRAQQFSNFNQ